MQKTSNWSFGRVLSMASCLLFVGGQSVQAQELRNLNNQFKTESGCPVEVVKATTTLEIDPIGTPMACRIYIDYKNVSTKPVSGVKFRIGYIDAEEKVRGTFHAPDGHVLEPGGMASAKWRGEKIDPRTASVLIRVLVARYSDGRIWESEKMKGLAPGTGGEGQTVAPSAPSTGSGSQANPAAAPQSQADSFDSLDSGAAPQQGSSAASSGQSASSSSAQSATPDSSTTPAQSASPAAQPAGSDKSTDGY